MRKKSHVLVARYIADHLQHPDIESHRKAFCLGSILPDLKPSFLTQKHEFYGTFVEVQEQMKTLAAQCEDRIGNQRAYCRKLGEIIHYIADYFTFPHNSTYEGSLSDHCIYEKNLKNHLKEMILSGDAEKYAKSDMKFECVEDILVFIEQAHEVYVSHTRKVEEDTKYILTICYQVVQGIFRVIRMHNDTVLLTNAS